MGIRVSQEDGLRHGLSDLDLQEVRGHTTDAVLGRARHLCATQRLAQASRLLRALLCSAPHRGGEPLQQVAIFQGLSGVALHQGQWGVAQRWLQVGAQCVRQERAQEAPLRVCRPVWMDAFVVGVMTIMISVHGDHSDDTMMGIVDGDDSNDECCW